MGTGADRILRCWRGNEGSTVDFWNILLRRPEARVTRVLTVPGPGSCSPSVRSLQGGEAGVGSQLSSLIARVPPSHKHQAGARDPTVLQPNIRLLRIEDLDGKSKPQSVSSTNFKWLLWQKKEAGSR